MVPRIDSKTLEISAGTYKQNVYLIGMYLRDATNILAFLRSNPDIGKSDLLAKAVMAPRSLLNGLTS